MTTPTTDVLRDVRRAWAPPPTLTVSQFADQEIILTTGPLAGSHWRTDFAPFQRGILDAVHEPGVETIVVMGSSQWGKTSCAIAICAYFMAHEPCPILIVEPTVDPMARDFAKNRLEPIIDASPTLRDCVSKKRARDASNTVLAKTFRGGSLSIGGANSAASLAARSIRLLILDEIDRYPPELPGEGATLAVAIKRTTTYRRRRRIVMLSSPTLKGAPIDSWFQRGDQRYYHVPCPICGTMHRLQWANVRYVNRDPSTARLVCPSCGGEFGDAERVAILGSGEWVASHPERTDPTIVSFHLSELYSPMSSLVEIVRGFLRAMAALERGDRSELHAWTNTTLGEPIDLDDGEGADSNALLLRREPREAGVDVPAGACCLTMGVDTQDDRLEALVLAWGPGEECWIVDRHTLPGDTTQRHPWEMLDELLDRRYAHASGRELMIHAACIDSAGHRTDLVYDYCARKAARRVYAIIGRDGQRPLVSSPSPKAWGKSARKVPLYTVGVDTGKSLWTSRLSLVEPGPGYVHLPHADWSDEELVLQLTAERLVTKWERGLPTQVWKKIRARNEALDMAVYGLAALRLLNPRLPQMLALLGTAPVPGRPTPERQAAPSPAPSAPRPQAPARRSVSSFLSGGGRRGW